VYQQQQQCQHQQQLVSLFFVLYHIRLLERKSAAGEVLLGQWVYEWVWFGLGYGERQL
jgi:hypothetical protein